MGWQLVNFLSYVEPGWQQRELPQISSTICFHVWVSISASGQSSKTSTEPSPMIWTYEEDEGDNVEEATLSIRTDGRWLSAAFGSGFIDSILDDSRSLMSVRGRTILNQKGKCTSYPHISIISTINKKTTVMRMGIAFTHPTFAV